jgi:hypothetical protein
MPDRLRAALTAAVVIAGPLLSGCGSTSTPTTNPSPSVSAAGQTKAHFVAEAEVICSALSRQEVPLKARQESLKRLPSTSAAQAFVTLARQFVAYSQTADAKLHALPRPPGDTGAIARLLSNFSEEVADAGRIAIAAASQESPVGEVAEKALERSAAETTGLAGEYGMKLCMGGE